MSVLKIHMLPKTQIKQHKVDCQLCQIVDLAHAMIPGAIYILGNIFTFSLIC